MRDPLTVTQSVFAAPQSAVAVPQSVVSVPQSAAVTKDTPEEIKTLAAMREMCLNLNDESFIKLVYETKRPPKGISIADIIEQIADAGSVQTLLKVFCSRGKMYDFEATTGSYLQRMGVDYRVATVIHGKLEDFRDLATEPNALPLGIIPVQPAPSIGKYNSDLMSMLADNASPTINTSSSSLQPFYTI